MNPEDDTTTLLDPLAEAQPGEDDMSHSLLSYYEAIEQASADMLSAARDGNWDSVV